MLLFDISLFIIALVLISYGSKRVLIGGNKIASKLALSGVTAGALVFATLTAMPELFSTIYTVYNDSGSVGFANLVGTNIHNIPLAIGIPAMFTIINYEKFARKICLTMLGNSLPNPLMLGLSFATRPLLSLNMDATDFSSSDAVTGSISSLPLCASARNSLSFMVSIKALVSSCTCSIGVPGGNTKALEKMLALWMPVSINWRASSVLA